MLDLSIIIVSYNTVELTTQCLDSIASSLSKSSIDLEVIVVDNSSTDDSVDRIKKTKLYPLGCTVIKNDTNVGFGKANNIGLKKARGKYILFLNSDTMVHELNLKELLQIMDSDTKIGVLTVRVNLENGALDPASHRGFPTLWRSFTYFSKLELVTKNVPLLNRFFGGYHLIHLDLNKTHEIDSPSGAFFLTRKSILDVVGGFDEDFFMYGEDLDLAKRIKEAGYKIIFFPGQSITHLKGKSGMKHDDKNKKKATSNFFYEAMRIFFDKHYSTKYPKLVTRMVHALIDFQFKIRNSKS